MKGQIDAQDGDALTAEELALIEHASDVPAVPDAAPDAPEDTTQENAAVGVDSAGSLQRPKMVPHQALHEARRLYQETEQRLAEERRARQTLEERLNIILQHVAQQPAAPEVKPLPSVEEDPVGHILGEINQQKQLLGAIVQAVSGQTQQSDQARAVQSLAIRTAAMEREFAAQNPDYQTALEHLVAGRRRELKAAGWQDDAEIDMMMSREATQLAMVAMQRGQNPAAVLYEVSKARGYQPPASDPASEAGKTAVQPNLAAAAQIEMMARGQSQARGINRVAGQATPPINANTVANMSDDEFAAWIKKASPAEKRSVGLGA